jgi:hypothetical protein
MYVHTYIDRRVDFWNITYVCTYTYMYVYPVRSILRHMSLYVVKTPTVPLDNTWLVKILPPYTLAGYDLTTHELLSLHAATHYGRP